MNNVFNDFPNKLKNLKFTTISNYLFETKLLGVEVKSYQKTFCVKYTN